MIFVDLKTKAGRSLLLLTNMSAIEYDEGSGELSFIGDSTAKPVYLDKGTPAKDVWTLIHKSFSGLYEGRPMKPMAYCAPLDVTCFQTEEPSF